MEGLFIGDLSVMNNYFYKMQCLIYTFIKLIDKFIALTSIAKQ